MKKTVLASLVCFASAASPSTMKPCPPFDIATAAVTSEEAAITHAKRVWQAIYDNNASWRKRFGSESIESFDPYSAVLNGGFWFVSGRPRNGKLGPTLQICASDGTGSIGGP
jgi:hypothetical protein